MHLLKTKNVLGPSQQTSKILLKSFIRCVSYKNSEDPKYQYLQKSIVPTMHFQKSLPRLPVPELEKSCTRYLNAIKPLVSEAEFNKTSQLVQTFKEKEGKALHEELVATNKNNKQTSYISKPWFDMYLKSRDPVVLNFNPFMAFKDDPRPEYNDQLIRSTNLLISTLRFHKSLQDNLLEPDVFHLNPKKSNTHFFRRFTSLLPSSVSWYGAYLMNAYPLDMVQFKNLFKSTRIPCKNKDEIKNFPNSKHMLVLKDGHFYVFDALDQNGNILPPSTIHSYMKYIHSQTSAPPSHPVSIFTTDNRDSWAEARQLLVQAGNGDALNLIDSALYCLILDGAHGDDLVKMGHSMLHGPAYNRWFDKCFQLIVSKEGTAAVNFEHSWGDGVAMMRLFDEVYADTTTNAHITPDSKPADVDVKVRKLDFQLTDELKNRVEQAKSRYATNTKRLRLDPLVYNKMNKDFIKNNKLSPDLVMQLSFQMGYYKLFGKVPTTYESCSTAAFKHGRTETVRPATMETKGFLEAFHQSGRPGAKTLREMIDNCSTVHNQLTKEAALGQGFDRHLFCLKEIALQRGQTLPELYLDPVFAYVTRYVLSTSTLPSPAFKAGAFAPVVPNGYGVGYAVKEDSLGVVLSSYSDQTDGKSMIDAIEKSLDDIQSIVLESKQ